MKKKIICGLIVSMLFITNVYATSGALRKNSIKTCPNGITYGYHSSSGTIHWHQARADSDVSSGWIAIGEAIYNDPCSSDDSSSDNNSNNESNNSTDDSSTNSNSSNSNTDSSNDNINNSSSTSESNNSSNNSNTSSSSNTNKSETTKKEETKSNDNTLKKVIIDNEIYEYFENIVYTTNNENINIEVVTNDDKASYEIQGLDSLNIGENYINIVVTAEDETVKTYNILINREKILSSEVGINITIDGDKVVFENYKATIYIDSSVTKASIDYALSDENATVEMDEISELEVGDNTLNIKVTAEDGTTQDYEIIIHRYSKTEDVIYTILSLGLISGTGYGVYFIIKKIKNK